MSLTQINKAGLDEIALDHVFTIGASGSSAYTFQGEGLNGTVNNPTLYLTRGKTYRFENGSGGHPIRIQSTSGASGTAYNTGVTNNAGSGTVIVEVQHDAPDVLYYQCTSHSAMNGILYITGALPDGGVTTAKIATGAVTTEKINDNAVTSAKIPADAIGNSEIAANAISGTEMQNNSISTGHIVDQAVTLAKLPHGTSSNDGKFLRANNGADPSFETVTSTTINNNADNRVITGSGTANTLNGEANLFFDGSQLGVGTTSPYQYSVATFESTNGIALQGSSQSRLLFRHTGGGTNLKMMDIQSSNGVMKFRSLDDNTTATNRVTIDASGKVGIGTTTIGEKLTIGDGDLKFYNSNEGSNHRTTFIEFQNSSNRITSESNFGSDGSSAYAAGYKFTTKNYTGSAFETLTPLVIQANGRIGLSTTSPLGTLGLQVMTNARVHFRNIGDIQSAQAGAGVGIDVLNDGNSANMDCAIRAANIYLKTTAGESVRINRHGFVKMKGDMANHMSADGDNYHEIQADNANIQILNMKHGSTNGYGIMMQLNHNKATHWAHRVYNFANGQTRMYIRADGDLENTNNSYGSTSDVKLKENIIDAPSQWDDIKALRVRNFNYIADENKQKLLGLVAQEAETVCPSLVKEQPDTDADNKDLGTTTKFLKYSVLYMKAIKALQEAQTRIETLETKVAALEAA